jgi:hypothetical protein
MGERAELKRRLHWAAMDEIVKFYDHKGGDTWYYLRLRASPVIQRGHIGEE